MCTGFTVGVCWLLPYILVTAPGFFQVSVCQKVDLMDWRLQECGKWTIPGMVREKKNVWIWHERFLWVAISQGWNRERWKEWHWLDYSANHGKREWEEMAQKSWFNSTLSDRHKLITRECDRLWVIAPFIVSKLITLSPIHPHTFISGESGRP